MPLFEYRCKTCNYLFEELISGNRDEAVPCPACNSKETEKQMSAIGGISMGNSSIPSCSSSCSGATSCTSGGCPYGNE